MKRFLFLLIFILAGCSSNSKEPHDPLESTNRKIYAFNSAVEKNIMRPVAKGYKAVAPSWFRKRITNFFRNIATPVIIFNDILQGEGTRASESLYRFMVNTTFGLGGTFDVAEEFAEVKYHSEDFGQTLAVWGIPEGPYITVPFLYPMSTRELTGKVVDIFLDPVYEEPPMKKLNTVERVGVGALDVFTAYAENTDKMEMLEKSAMDPYAMTLSVLHQMRQDEINNGEAKEESTESYDFDMGDDDEEEDEE
ncbi:MAG: MlaA family lipoprotein [Alphaproteobacteria bacterium]|nr:MAG: hypothetical protein B6I23_01350 [Rickettsiaceae bacterium 4572_127]